MRFSPANEYDFSRKLIVVAVNVQLQDKRWRTTFKTGYWFTEALKVDISLVQQLQ